MEKETLTLIVKISKPSKNGKFYKNGQEISVSERFKLDNNSDNTEFTLTIADITLEENATFSYRIENAETSCTVMVKGKEIKNNNNNCIKK